MAEPVGMVFDIREFCLHDGPGLRTTVFLKGCPLSCLWCHNPEGQSPQPQIMRNLAVACLDCGNCAKVCKHPGHCLACGDCVSACPAGRIHLCGEKMTAQELADRLLRDREVLAKSGGGVTFSGGEPLVQLDFLLAVTKLVAPLPVAVETSGYAPPSDYARMLAAVDLVLQDWKCSSENLHRRLTGVSNANIKANVALLARSGRPFLLRLPLVPGLNDGDAELEAAAEFFASLNATALREVQLLPYHGGAAAKYRQLGLDRAPLRLTAKGINPSAVEIFRTRGLPCSFPFGSEVMAE